jgi:hypothetical protein
VLVSHTCYPSYSGGRDQEDCSSKPAWANNFMRPYLKKPFTKIGLVEWLRVKALSSSPSTTHTKIVLRLCLIKSTCPIGDILMPLNCCKVSANNSYKVLQEKYKMTPILKNVCPGLPINTCQSHFPWPCL